METLEGRLEALKINPLGLCKHQRGLRKTRDVLVDARHQHVRTCLQCMRWQVGMEAEVGAPGRIDRQRNPVGMDDLRNRGDIRDTTDIARLDEHHCLGVRMFTQRLRNALDGYASGQAGLGIDVGLHPDGDETGQHEAEEERLV